MTINTCGQCHHFDSTVAIKTSYSTVNGEHGVKVDPLGGLCDAKNKGTRSTSVKCKLFKEITHGTDV